MKFDKTRFSGSPQLLHVDGQTDRHEAAHSRFS